jgi:hypothetical protein
VLIYEAEDLGLLASDDLDAMKCFEAGAGKVVGDANCNGQINAIDAAIVLQYVAGLIDTLNCANNADANQNGDVNAIDGALILQYVADLIDTLPP